MMSLPGSSATNLLRVLFLGLSTLATTAARAEPELHVPAGLARLQAVEGAEVVLPAWYTLRGEASSTQPWEVLTLQWFLKQEGKELNQVREESVFAQSICARWGRREHLTAGNPSAQVFFAPILDAIRGSLSLKNLSTSMSGVYICKAYNEVGSAQCNVTLEVSTRSIGASVVAGAVMGTLIGLGLLAGLVLLYQHRDKAIEEPANNIKEDATAPRTLLWPKGSDTLSKNGTLSSVTSARALRPPHGPPKPVNTYASTPTPSLTSQAGSSPRLPWTDGPPSQPISPNPGGVSSSALSRMGAIPVMVPTQNHAGSLV
nr:PREDICTED: endothelial cell-selective adhesion molecule-like [Rhinolophus sinicus]